MKRMYAWMLAAILTVCGESVFTACSSNDDNAVQPVPEQSEAEKNRDKFIEHTRATVKALAENMNFESWEAANTYNMYFNQYVLLNKNLVSSLGLTILTMAAQNVVDVEEGSELAAMGIKRYINVDLPNFKYRFTMKDDNTTFDLEQADAFEFILNGFNPTTQQMEKGLYKIAMKSGGAGRKVVIPMKNSDAGAIVITIPYELEFALSSKFTGAWHNDFSGNVSFQLPEGATDTSKGFTAKATINSDILPREGKKGDKTQLDLTISSDRVNGHANVLGQFTTSSSIFEVIGAILGTRSIDEAKVTLLDDLTATMSISNLLKLLEIDSEYRTVGRNYADKATIDEYCKKMNEVVKAELYCKATNQTLPMRLTTTPVGIDYWAVYEVQFSENDYINLLAMLDRKTFAYVLNIMDHSADHMQNSVIIVRQLVEFVILLNKTFGDVNLPLGVN